LKIAIFASVRGVPVGLMPFRLVWKNENVWLPDGTPPDGEKKYEDMFIPFDSIHERDRWTNRHHMMA